MTAPTPPQAGRTQRVSDERLSQIAAFKPHAEHGDVANWVTMRHDELMAICAEAIDSRAESARLREQLHALEVDRKDMSLLIRRLCSKWHALRSPERVNEALDYLKRKGLMGNPLRDTDALAGKE